MTSGFVLIWLLQIVKSLFGSVLHQYGMPGLAMLIVGGVLIFAVSQGLKKFFSTPKGIAVIVIVAVLAFVGAWATSPGMQWAKGGLAAAKKKTAGLVAARKINAKAGAVMDKALSNMMAGMGEAPAMPLPSGGGGIVASLPQANGLGGAMSGGAHGGSHGAGGGVLTATVAKQSAAAGNGGTVPAVVLAGSTGKANASSSASGGKVTPAASGLLAGAVTPTTPAMPNAAAMVKAMAGATGTAATPQTSAAKTNNASGGKVPPAAPGSLAGAATPPAPVTPSTTAMGKAMAGSTGTAATPQTSAAKANNASANAAATGQAMQSGTAKGGRQRQPAAAGSPPSTRNRIAARNARRQAWRARNNDADVIIRHHIDDTINNGVHPHEVMHPAHNGHPGQHPNGQHYKRHGR